MASMTKSSSTVYVDTSFFKAFLDPKDDFHDKALALWDSFHQQKTKLITTNYILDESFTLIRIRCTLPVAIKLRYLLYKYSAIIEIVRVEVEDEARVWEWFENDWHHLSFTDCVSFAVMKRLELTDVATFDDHFARAGFTALPNLTLDDDLSKAEQIDRKNIPKVEREITKAKTDL